LLRNPVLVVGPNNSMHHNLVSEEVAEETKHSNSPLAELQYVIHSSGRTKHCSKYLSTPTLIPVILNMQLISTGYALVGVIFRPITQYFSYKTHAI
jgi:hypothetical protein